MYTQREEDVECGRKEVESILRKYRMVDNVLHEGINKGNIHTCEKHNKPEDFMFTPIGRKKVKLYLLPTESRNKIARK